MNNGTWNTHNYQFIGKEIQTPHYETKEENCSKLVHEINNYDTKSLFSTILFFIENITKY